VFVQVASPLTDPKAANGMGLSNAPSHTRLKDRPGLVIELNREALKKYGL
jgi:hypothetical protein